MKTRTLTTLTLVALAVVTGAFAQCPLPMIADVPFEFIVGAKTLPAGQYAIDACVVRPALALHNSDRSANTFVLGSPLSTQVGPVQPRLVFNRYGDTYFLSQIWGPADDRGLQLRKSKAEREMARSASGVQVASILAKKSSSGH